ncbi:hypothetical protein AWB75_05122 [Caballeronia catudaia]|uniref:Uncharacterized protein n=1 Tax=Caballeronia catudaia TaxID=1777136 RepID=A0A158CGU5_9BURK|nr:hypothetical protein AWB75_05122 [Caballeronia catudaia]
MHWRIPQFPPQGLFNACQLTQTHRHIPVADGRRRINLSGHGRSLATEPPGQSAHASATRLCSGRQHLGQTLLRAAHRRPHDGRPVVGMHNQRTNEALADNTAYRLPYFYRRLWDSARPGSALRVKLAFRKLMRPERAVHSATSTGQRTWHSLRSPLENWKLVRRFHSPSTLQLASSCWHAATLFNRRASGKRFFQRVDYAARMRRHILAAEALPVREECSSRPPT